MDLQSVPLDYINLITNSMSFPLLAPGAGRSVIRAQTIALPGGQLQEKGGSDTDFVETKLQSEKQEQSIWQNGSAQKIV